MFSWTKILPLEAPPADGNLGVLPPSQLTDHEIEERELQAEQNNSNRAPAAVATHTNTIGIIYPPPDIRKIVEKTAQFVSKYGLVFENKVKADKANNPNFNFLKSDHPFHAFYQHKITEYSCQNQDGAQDTDFDNTEDPQLDAESEACDAKPDTQAPFRVPTKPLEAPEPEKYTVRLPGGIMEEELEIIKHTAQFVARNGQPFIRGLMSREMNNPQFQFMKSTHSMFTFFTSLVDAYSEVLMPPRDLKEKLRKSGADLTTVLERCLNRLEWDRSQEQQRKIEEDEKEKERVQMALIDWHANDTANVSATAALDVRATSTPFDDDDETTRMQHGMPVPPPPGSQFSHLQVPPLSMAMMQPPPMPGIPPPPPPREAPPPLPEEPEPKRQKFDESTLVPEDQFLAQHPGSATIRVSKPNADDGQVIEITVQSLSENVGSLKEKIAVEMQIPANKQKLSGKAGFLKDNMSLAHYNVGAGEILTLSYRERGGRKR